MRETIKRLLPLILVLVLIGGGITLWLNWHHPDIKLMSALFACAISGISSAALMLRPRGKREVPLAELNFWLSTAAVLVLTIALAASPAT